MSKSAISGAVWAEMSEAQRIESVRDRRATLKEMVEGLLDGPDKLRKACREFLAHTDVCLEEIQFETETDPRQPEQPGRNPKEEAGRSKEESISDRPQGVLMDGARKRRMGLPEGYVPRPHRH